MRFERGKRGIAILTLLAVGAVVLRSELPAEATSSTLHQIEEAERERDELERNRSETEGNLDALNTERNSLRGELSSLNTHLAEVGENLADLEARIETKQWEIEETREALEEAIRIEEWQYENMVIRLHRMYERGETSYLNALISGELAEFVTAADFFARIEDYEKRKLQEYKDNRALIEEEKARLEREEAELEELKVEAEAEHAKVSGLIGQAQAAIGQYTNQIAETEAEIDAYEAQIDAMNDDIAALKRKYQEELEMSRRAANSTWRSIGEVTFEESDRYLLANLIYCEAGGEPYDGQLAVGAVVINRVLSSIYPNTVSGVIYQSGQFSPVASGRLALALAEGRATESCYRAADEAMSGMTNVGTCVYFRTPIEGLTGIQIGGHIFY